MWPEGVALGVAAGVLWVFVAALDRRTGWEVLPRVALVVFDRGFGWEVLCWEVAWRVSGGGMN